MLCVCVCCEECCRWCLRGLSCKSGDPLPVRRARKKEHNHRPFFFFFLFAIYVCVRQSGWWVVGRIDVAAAKVHSFTSSTMNNISNVHYLVWGDRLFHFFTGGVVGVLWLSTYKARGRSCKKGGGDVCGWKNTLFYLIANFNVCVVCR